MSAFSDADLRRSPKVHGFTAATSELLQDGPHHIVDVKHSLWRLQGGETFQTRAWAEIQYWLTKNPGEMLHEGIEGSWQESRFYFKDREFARCFREAVPELISREGPLFDSISDHPLEGGEIMSVGAILKFALSLSYDDLTQWFWCKDNLKGRIWYIAKSSMAIFEDADDCCLFKMKFVGNEETKEQTA